MFKTKPVIALLMIIAVCLAILTGIKVQEDNEQKRVLKEAKEQADRESKEWQKIKNRTNEDVRRELGYEPKGP